jgi:hypothetical protein
MARGSSNVVAWESSKVMARDSSNVVARDSSNVVARESSNVVARDSSKVEAKDMVTVIVKYNGPTITLDGQAAEVNWASGFAELRTGIMCKSVEPTKSKGVFNEQPCLALVDRLNASGANLLALPEAK